MCKYFYALEYACVCCIKLARHGKRVASKHIIYQIYVHKNQIYMFVDREESCIVVTRTHARAHAAHPNSQMYDNIMII